jgi:hypothetical protein
VKGGTVSNRTISVLIWAVVAASSGCSTSPVAPSVVASTQTTAAVTGTSSNSGVNTATRFGKRTPGVVFVTSQQLYYDTFVVKDPLPMEGKFQLLEGGTTEFGPGQPGYRGGRWWEDLNGDGIQDAGDHYFLCPLLPPGRPTP